MCTRGGRPDPAALVLSTFRRLIGRDVSRGNQSRETRRFRFPAIVENRTRTRRSVSPASRFAIRATARSGGGLPTSSRASLSRNPSNRRFRAQGVIASALGRDPRDLSPGRAHPRHCFLARARLGRPGHRPQTDLRTRCSPRPSADPPPRSAPRAARGRAATPVSYTHLTLPTILLV